MNLRVKQILMLVLAGGCLFGSSRIQQSLNGDRDTLGLTRATVLENAPPVLAFTTVALGGFRGLISNILWIRTTDLQQDDKYFESAQLASWITKLEPTYEQVWIYQAWNMAYNISVKFKENSPGVYADRWRWVERGLELLRDEGLKYNPNSVLIYRELAWYFQHKMGQALDDGNRYYKVEWAQQMKDFFGPDGTNFDRLLQPQSAVDYQRLNVLTNRYKIDPIFAKKLDDTYGPFDWRLPEAHAVYWAAKGLEAARNNPDKVTDSDLITLRRAVYQSMMQSFAHGRILRDPFNHIYLGVNLDIIPHVNNAYLDSFAAETDPSMQSSILTSYRSFLRDAVYALYEANQLQAAEKWFKVLGERFPNKPIVENDPNSLPGNLTLDEYAFDVIQIDVGENSPDRVTRAIEGYIRNAYEELAMGDDDRYTGFYNLAQKVYNRYGTDTKHVQRIVLPPWDDMNRAVIGELLDPRHGMIYSARAALRSALRLPAEQAAVPATNSVPAAVEMPVTNGVDTNAAAPATP